MHWNIHIWGSNAKTEHRNIQGLVPGGMMLGSSAVSSQLHQLPQQPSLSNTACSTLLSKPHRAPSPTAQSNTRLSFVTVYSYHLLLPAVTYDPRCRFKRHSLTSAVYPSSFKSPRWVREGSPGRTLEVHPKRPCRYVSALSYLLPLCASPPPNRCLANRVAGLCTYINPS